MRSQKRCRQIRRGVSTVEMALCAPLMFMLILGLMDISYACMARHLIQDAARQGCREALSPSSTNASVTAVVNDLLSSAGFQAASTSILVNGAMGSLSSAKNGDEIQVQIQLDAQHASILPGLGYLNAPLTAVSGIRRN